MAEIHTTNDDDRWKLLKYKVLENSIADLFKIFRENGIEPILIKGWAAGQFYPRRFERVFSDVDLAVSPSDFEKASQITLGKNLTVDLHNGLDKFGLRNWEDLFHNSILLETDGCGVRVLRPEDHLKILCVHWLGDGGIYKEKLKDIKYLIESSDLDWARVFVDFDERKQKWLIVTIGLAEMYFGLKANSLPEAIVEKSKNIPNWILRTLEKEWRNPIPLRPLQTCLKERKMLFQQVLKRIPPNPIQATVETEGEFDDKSRVLFQIKNTLRRLRPSVQRIVKTVITGKKY